MAHGTDVVSVKMRRREVEAMLEMIRRQQEFLTADEQAAMESFETALSPPRGGNWIDGSWKTDWLATVGKD